MRGFRAREIPWLLTSRAVVSRNQEGPMPEQIKKRLEEEIKQLEYELTTELPAEIKQSPWAT